MNALMMTILSLSLSGGILIAVLFLCKPLYRRRLSKGWQYYIWLIVIMRLILPFSFEVNLVGGLIDMTRRTEQTAQRDTVPAAASPQISQFAITQPQPGEVNEAVPGVSRVYPNVPATGSASILGPQAAAPPPQYVPPVQMPHSRRTVPEIMTQNLWMAWLFVAAALFIRKISIYQSFVGYVKAGRAPVACIEKLEQFGRILEQQKIKRVIGLYVNPQISSPLTMGFFRPYIVLPTLELGESDFKYTVLHELTHFKRRDMFYKWLVQLAVCLHWFNPLVHLMAREINNLGELSCDESVIADLDHNGMRAYGDTLLNAINVGGRCKNAIAAVTLISNKKILAERFDAIMNFKKKSRAAVAAAIFITLILSIAAVTTGAYAVTNRQTQVADSQVSAPETPRQNFVFAAPPAASVAPAPVPENLPNPAPLRINFSGIRYDTPIHHHRFQIPTTTRICGRTTFYEISRTYSSAARMRDFNGGNYMWPFHFHSVTNMSDRAIVDYTLVSLAFDCYGNPLQLYWDALNVAPNGQIGSIGFADGYSMGIVTGISPVSPRAYAHSYRHIHDRSCHVAAFRQSWGDARVDNWLENLDNLVPDLIQRASHREEVREEYVLQPGQTVVVAQLQIDGWNQTTGERRVQHITSIVKQVEFECGEVWMNPQFDTWRATFEGRRTLTIPTAVSQMEFTIYELKYLIEFIQAVEPNHGFGPNHSLPPEDWDRAVANFVADLEELLAEAVRNGHTHVIYYPRMCGDIDLRVHETLVVPRNVTLQEVQRALIGNQGVYFLPYDDVSHSLQAAARRAESFEIYRDFGLVYNRETGRLYWNGELVRYFEDMIPLPNGFGEFGIMHTTEGGTVDVRAVRDLSQMVFQGTIDRSLGLLGLEAFPQEEFDARDIEELLNPPQFQSVAVWPGQGTVLRGGEFSVTQVTSDPFLPPPHPPFAEDMLQFEQLGVTFYNIWATECGRMAFRTGSKVYYRGQLVRRFIDRGGHTSFSSSTPGGRIDMYVLRDDEGYVSGVEVTEIY